MEYQIGETVFRHGDVHLKKSDKTLTTPDVVQALLHKGQNNHHMLRGLFRIQETPNEKILEVIEPTELYHEEHATLKLTPGSYQVDIQQEYDHWLEESRNVID